MKKIFLLSLLLFLPINAHAFILSNFETPESMVVDSEEGFYYVSNVNGPELTGKDGNGYISKIDPSGNTVIQKFIGGDKEAAVLNGPKGLLLYQGNIFVSDIDTVKAFDKTTGKSAVLIDISRLGAKFLNDLVADDRGYIYVSDMLANKIFRIHVKDGYSVTVYLEGEALGQPNGLLINPKNKNLIIATFGSGELLEVDRLGKVHVLKRGLSTLDGIDCDAAGNIYVSSFEKGEIYKIAGYGRGALTTYLSGLLTPADISLDRKKNEILIPSFKGNTVSTASLKNTTPK